MTGTTIPARALLEIYRLMVATRRIEETVGRSGGYHAAIGEEAVVVGAFYGLASDDYIAPHYRGALAAAYLRGADLRRLAAGVTGKATGYSGGRFRGDICMPLEKNVIGLFSGILASSVGTGTGAALSLKLLRKPNVVVVSFGEGTSNLGLVHESLNLAATLQLPVVYVCQNNQYAMATSSRVSMRCASVADRAAGYGIPGVRADGNDVIEVHRAVQTAVRRARSGAGPTLIEALTYRVSGHRAGERVSYQDEAERRCWLERDPLQRLERTLAEQRLLDDAARCRMGEDIQREIDVAIALAESDPDPPAEALNPDAVFAPATYCEGNA